MLDLSLPRGIRDIEPEEYRLQSDIQEKFEQVARIFNFKLMQPAPIEHLAVLRAKSGSDIDKEIYAFKDKGGRDIGLRFDLTVGITRYVCSRRDLKPPMKLGCVGSAWRYEEPQHARYRWLRQWDLEIFGPPTIEADAEVIDASNAIFSRLGLDSCVIQIGDRRVVEEFITKILEIDSAERAVELMRALDKVQKKTYDELETEYKEKGFEASMLKSLFDFGSLRGAPNKVLAKLEELNLSSASELASLMESLRSRGLREFEFNMSIVRGIDYYTSVVFEIVDKKNPDLGSLCGGGRYDALPKIFGRPELTGTGAAGGMDRAAMSLRGPTSESSHLVYVIRADADAKQHATSLLAKLRAENVQAEADLQERSLSKQLETAGILGARWSLIVGKIELEAGLLILKDMVNRTEEKLTFEEALSKLKRP
jgi:histidyl-tRNA synthetase